MEIIFGLVCRCRILTTVSDRAKEGSAPKSAQTSKDLRFISLLNARGVVGEACTECLNGRRAVLFLRVLPGDAGSRYSVMMVAQRPCFRTAIYIKNFENVQTFCSLSDLIHGMVFP